MRASQLAKLLLVLLLLPVLLSAVFLICFASALPSTPQLPSGPYPGDDIVPDAVMVYDRVRRRIRAPASAV